MIDRRLIENFDWGLLFITLTLYTFGATILYSASTAGFQTGSHVIFKKQIVWYGIGLFLMSLICLIDYKKFERWSIAFYVFCLLLLVAVLVLGKQAGGSQRWLKLGPMTIQPSETIKIAVTIMLARYYSKVVSPKGLTLKELIKPLAIIILPFILIVKQPDLGTAMMVFVIAASITVFVKIEKKTLILILISGILAASGAWNFLKEYQKQRILTFIDPDRDPLGAGYHIIQSKISIGSGMITGKGFLKGTQNALSFLPEQHTDFIFSVLAEEWGFIGGFALILVYIVLIIWGLNISFQCRDNFGKILAVGVTALIFWQIFINMGMVMGLMPVVGVPLPLISYGGSSVVTIMMCIGILMSISIRKFNV